MLNEKNELFVLDRVKVDRPVRTFIPDDSIIATSSRKC